MASYFFDSSAVIKRYHREPGTDWVRAICEPRNHPPLYLSELAQVEVAAALRRVGRSEHLHPSFIDAMANTFERHIALSEPSRPRTLYILVPISRSVLALAASLCHKYWDVRPSPLRSLDAIQLACALAAAVDLSEELIFVTADIRLTAIAALEGFSVIHPAYPPHP